jgi:hypothetical protein
MIQRSVNSFGSVSGWSVVAAVLSSVSEGKGGAPASRNSIVYRKKAAGKDPAAFRTTVTVCGEKPPLSCHLEPWFLSSPLGIKMRFLRSHPITPLLGMRVTLWKELFRILPYLVTRIPVLGFRARLFGQVAQRWCWPAVLFFARRSIASPENSIHWGKNAQTRAKPGECITIGKPRSPRGRGPSHSMGRTTDQNNPYVHDVGLGQAGAEQISRGREK